MLTTSPLVAVQERLPEIAELCRAHQVRRLSMFGSALRNDFDPERSDLDLLVEFVSTVEDRTGAQSRFGDALEALLGRRVDTVRPDHIRHPLIERSILATAIEIYPENRLGEPRPEMTMPVRDVRVYLEDMGTNGERLARFVAGRTYHE
jgi:predicted nucleotidyltransferase